MSLTREQLQTHCQVILESRRIKRKIIILCEGGLPNLDERLSPQFYRKMEQLPDANFYKACVPKDWRELKPIFFNCGDRKDVIDTYFMLKGLHNEDSRKSYLDPERLFAIIDLDLQVQEIDNYNFSNTEEIFQSLYREFKLNETEAKQHRIWVTGLIHKEAYFLLPELQSILGNLINLPTPNYNNYPLKLDNIYTDIANEILMDCDLQDNSERALKRVQQCSNLDCSGLQQFQDSWKQKYKQALNELDKKKLVFALLTVRKAKSYWENLQPPEDWPRTSQDYRDQLSLKIAEYYSQNIDDHYNHIASFFKSLKEICSITQNR